jgi:hypothetical protein
MLLASSGSAEPGRADAEQAVQDEVDLAQVLVEQALEDQDR